MLSMKPRRGAIWPFVAAILGVAVLTGVVTALLVSIYQHKQEAKNPYLRFVNVTEQTTNVEPWGLNWPRELDQYKKTALSSKTNFGGGDAHPAQKAQTYPFLTRMFAGYAFSLDFRDRRGHAYMLFDQEHTRRVTERPQPGACLNCHASVVPTYRRLGEGDLQAGMVKLAALPYAAALDEVTKTGSLDPQWNGTTQQMAHVSAAHPVGCVDCHDPATMQLRVNRPAFVSAIRAFKASQGVAQFDVNRDATRQEMRTFVCAQCHVEYYCGPKVTLFYPWDRGVKVEQIESHYNDYRFPDGHRFYDWVHAETGAELLKAQHPEFETWNQGIHARSGVACADCHMPYTRQGAMKVADHWVRSPMTNVSHACQQCHQYPEAEIQGRVAAIQGRNYALLQQSGQALLDMLDTVKLVRKPFNESHQAQATQLAQEKLAKDKAFATLSPADQQTRLTKETQEALNGLWSKEVYRDAGLTQVAELHRKAQWRLDFVAAENSMGFHAPQETSRILGESIDLFRQAQILASRRLPGDVLVPVTGPLTPTTQPSH